MLFVDCIRCHRVVLRHNVFSECLTMLFIPQGQHACCSVTRLFLSAKGVACKTRSQGASALDSLIPLYCTILVITLHCHNVGHNLSTLLCLLCGCSQAVGVILSQDRLNVWFPRQPEQLEIEDTGQPCTMWTYTSYPRSQAYQMSSI